MISLELIKYVTLQLMVLSASLDENLSKAGGGHVLPLVSETSPLPSNLPALTADAVARVAMLRPANTPGNPPPAAAGAPGEMAAATVTSSEAKAPSPAVQAAPPVHVAAASSTPVVHPPASPVAPAAPAAPSHGRRKRRSVSGAVSELADSVERVAGGIAENHWVGVAGAAPVAGAVAAMADGVEQLTKPRSTYIGEALLY